MPDGPVSSPSSPGHRAASPAGRKKRLWAVLAMAVAALCALSVYGLNGAPLYYFDTAAYLDQGNKMMVSLGIETAPAAVSPTVSPTSAPPGGTDDAGGGDETVDASRSAVYALFLSGVAAIFSLDVAVLCNFGLIFLAVFVVARRLSGRDGPSPWLLTGAAIVAGSLAALPFYVAFLMPDILTSVLILMIALLCAYAGVLSRVETALAGLLALGAVLAHPSHLVLAALVLPVAVFASPVLKGRRVILAIVLLVCIVGLGALERVAFSAAVERFEKKRAQALPFVTARLINDGPGLAYLDAHCPDPEIATCALSERLARSDNPERLRAPNILFSVDAEIGSYKFLTPDQKAAIAGEQLRFAANVVKSDPVWVLAALGRNTLVQLVFVRIDMTVPPPALAGALKITFGSAADDLRNGRLVLRNRSWFNALAYWHWAVYLASVGVLVYLLASRRLDPRARTFALIVFAGILANALVCGGISVPAHRYGARAALVLPILAALLAGVQWGRARQAKSPSG